VKQHGPDRHGLSGSAGKGEEAANLISVEKHDGARVVQLIHGVEVGDLCDVDQVYDAIIFDELGD
jgi:hypothetical protein